MQPVKRNIKDVREVCMKKYRIHINLFIVALGIVFLALTANHDYAPGGITYVSGLSHWEAFYYVSLPEIAGMVLYLLLIFNLFYENRKGIKEMDGNSRIEQLEAKIAQMDFNKMYAFTTLFAVFLFSIPVLFPRFNQMLYEDIFSPLFNESLFLRSRHLIANVITVGYLAFLYFWGMSNLKARAIKIGKTHPPGDGISP